MLSDFCVVIALGIGCCYRACMVMYIKKDGLLIQLQVGYERGKESHLICILIVEPVVSFKSGVYYMGVKMDRCVLRCLAGM